MKKVKSEKRSIQRLQDKYIGGDVVSGGQCQESCQIGGVAANVFVIVFVFVFVFVIVFLLVRSYPFITLIEICLNRFSETEEPWYLYLWTKIFWLKIF